MKFFPLFLLKALAMMVLFVGFLMLFGPAGFWLFLFGGAAVLLTGPVPRRPKNPSD